MKRSGSGSLVDIFKSQGATVKLPEGSPFKRKAPGEPTTPDETSQFKERHGEAVREELKAQYQRQANDMATTAERYARSKRKRDEIKASCGEPAKERGIPKQAGLAIGLRSNRRELGGPVLRRDPTAHAKLHMINYVKAKLIKAGLDDKSFKNVPKTIKSNCEVHNVTTNENCFRLKPTFVSSQPRWKAPASQPASQPVSQPPENIHG